MTPITQKNKAVEANTAGQHISYGHYGEEIESVCAVLDEKQTGQRLYDKDAYLWKTESEQVAIIKESLGWLGLPDHFKETTAELSAFALQIKEEGFTHAVLLGMGGSSLCSEVARETYGSAPGFPQLLVLDNTDPAAILDVERQVNMETTLFIVATKSGTTTETLNFFHYFYGQLQQKTKAEPGNNFVAITDAGSPLVKEAEAYKFRKIFINPSDIGGRYSVLSDFGLLPMALMGMDIDEVMNNAHRMKASCSAEVPAFDNPGINLGVTLGICQRHGRDKVTFILSDSIASFGYWVEQLIAESTGKEGTGLVPVNGEAAGDPEVYGDDRIFIHMYLAEDDNTANTQKMKALETAGHPVVSISVADKMALNAEYYRWEIAVAIAGLIIEINPFDQPNVTESKKNTNHLLEEWKKDGAFKAASPLVKEDALAIFGGTATAKLADKNKDSISDFITAFEQLAKPGDYVAFLPYFMMTDARSEKMQSWRMQTRDRLKVATTLLNGPRYLHSTGQLHKGGPATGLYILLSGKETEELAIPGEQYGFETLHEAQYLGDYRSLDDKNRRVIRIHLGDDVDMGLDRLMQFINNNTYHA